MIFFPSHWLLSHITIVKTTESGERGMNPVAMTFINPRKEYWPSQGSNQQPPFHLVLYSTEWAMWLRVLSNNWQNHGLEVFFGTKENLG